MKHLKKMLFFFLAIGITANAKTTETPVNTNYNNYDGNAYIFVEGTVEFSVFPDGQFDFVYLGEQNRSEVVITTPNADLSFNGGQDYEAYVQYDDYGAIVQVENIAVFYDEFGRISKAGNVDISYRNRRLVRVGGLRINYNNIGNFDYCTGFINPYNRAYVFRPWHTLYIRPLFNNCIVWDVPYRHFYTPLRFSYYNHLAFYNNRFVTPYNNCRRDFYNPGSRVHFRNGRTAVNRNYREGRRNTMVNNHGRRSSDALAINNTRINSRATATRDSRNSVTTTSRGTIRQENTSRATNPRAVNRGTSRNNSAAVPNTRSDRSKNTRNGNATRPSTSRSDRGTIGRPSSRNIKKNKGNTQGIALDRAPITSIQRSSSSRPKASAPKRSTRTQSATTRRSTNTSKVKRTSSPTKRSSRSTAPRPGRGL